MDIHCNPYSRWIRRLHTMYSQLRRLKVSSATIASALALQVDAAGAIANHLLNKFSGSYFRFACCKRAKFSPNNTFALSLVSLGASEPIEC